MGDFFKLVSASALWSGVGGLATSLLVDQSDTCC
jgi:hypothetical protein